MSPTEPRADDPAALVADARAEHQPFSAGDRCGECMQEWPCFTARLADALEAALTAQRIAQLGNDGLIRDEHAARAEAANATKLLEDAETLAERFLSERNQARAELTALREVHHTAP